jgi:hypothetical protein
MIVLEIAVGVYLANLALGVTSGVLQRFQTKRRQAEIEDLMHQLGGPSSGATPGT